MAPTTVIEARLANIESKLDRLLSLWDGLSNEVIVARSELNDLARIVRQHEHRLGLIDDPPARVPSNGT